MGKNRKLRNGVDQVQMQSCPILESGDYIQEIPENFLTSDDFCIVQNKRGSKKSHDSQNLVKSCSNSVKSFNKEGNCHMSFWTCRSDVSIDNNSDTIISSDSVLQLPKIAANISENCDFYINDHVNPSNDIIIEINSNTSAVENTNPEELVESEELEKLKESLGIKSLKNEVVENVLPDNKTVNVEKSISCTKKKGKKKLLKKKPVDEEIERLLEELDSNKELNSVKHKLSKPVICAADICSSNRFQLSNSNDCSHVVNKLPDITAGDEQNMKVEKEKLVSNINNGCELCSDKIVTTNGNSVLDKETESSAITEENSIMKISQKKKAKKSKQKKYEENGSSVNLKECKPDSLPNIQVEIINAHSSSEYKKIEPAKKCQKRPNKKQLAAIHEALRKAKEEEEKLRKEEEAKQKIAEEAEKIRLEKLRLEQEKKEKKKLKEKQRREKMKAEGRLLSKSQKQSRARMEATLAVLRQQGVVVPEISEKKSNNSHGPRLGSCKNFHRKRLDSCQSTQSSDSAIVITERQKSESFSSQESSGKDSVSDPPSSFDSNDDSLVPESDKGNISCSEESDALDDNLVYSDVTKEITHSESKTLTVKAIQEKTLTAYHNQNVCIESECKTKPGVKLRSPVVCVLGHVDTGKTKILDYIRKTHIQDSEAGGITQQIGATMIPRDALKEKCKMVKDFDSLDIKIPGLLVIDTPGHESFSNLRSRGSSICDIAVLVVDIMHGLEPQTIESINLLKKGKTPFVVALNKIDRIYGWKSYKDDDIENTIKKQSQSTQSEFKKRCQDVILQFANQCLNAALFYENKDPRAYVSMVPTSAVTGDGMGNILGTVSQLTQALMQKKLIYSNELEATVLEVKAIPGLGTTIDVILVNGRLQEGDTIVLAGQEGPIVTQIRSLLMPQPLKELRVKNLYIEYKTIDGAQGVKITGKDLEKSIAGLPLLVAYNHNVIDSLKEEICHLFQDTMNSIKTSERGVYVQASTLGSLEALLNFLKASSIPYFNVKIGPVVKKDVMKASIMLEHDILYAAILAFDVKIERDAQELADSLGVRIFHADIIYHLFDMYMQYSEDMLLKRTVEIRRLAVFPCKLRILPDFVFSVKDPIILGVQIEDGTLKEGTPLCVPSKGILEIGTVSTIEVGNSKVSSAKKGDTVCIKLDPKLGESPKIYGKHFNHEDLLVSRISRQSIDICKEHFRSDLQSDDWHLMVELKRILHIV